ncbi:MAG TPA: hypothetical protein EYH50_00960 [Pyrodictium delaneyi]|uniref:Peptidase M50 domain-containing protein n=1 Tax=Pyrodictium delaneyi TaxID=1273541 RepID=A0A832ZSF7_9CREN|nr:hypothetical protein [Pyrodictium delaneyi]
MNIIEVYASLAAWSILYMVIHEMLHYASARLLGYRVHMYIASDGILPSLSVRVHGDPQGFRRVVILYSPYLFNIAAIVTASTLPLKLIALFTLPNILLEENRNKMLTSMAAAIGIITAIALASSGPQIVN